MAQETAVYQFDAVEVHPGSFQVLRDGKPVPLEPKSIRVLLYLIENRERAVGKDELIQAVWQGTAVTDNALTRVVAQLRRELGDDAKQPRYIQTIPTLGYRFVGDLHAASAPARAPVPQWKWPYAAVAGLIVAGAVAGIVWVRPEPAAALRPAAHVQITSSPGLDLAGGFSPDGRSIAYASDRSGRFEIYRRALEGGGEVQITSDGAQNVDPRWSPDGRWIAYHSAAKGGLWLVPAGGGVPRRLTESGSQPSWSPDSKAIAFRSIDVFSISAADLMNVANSPAIVVLDVASGAVRQVAPPSPAQGFATWMPGGSRLLYSRFASGSGEVWTVRPDGSDRRKLFTAARNVFIAPAASPQGDAIYYGALSKARDFGLWMARLNAGRDGISGEPVEIARMGTSIPRNITLSADGRRLAYSSTSTSSTLWTIGGDGQPRPLYNHVVFRTSFPVFSPDGKRIAFFARLFGGLGDIWVMNADGTGAAPVTSSQSQDLLPSWTPDGSAIVYTRHSDGDGLQLWQVSLGDRSEKPLMNGKPLLGWPRLSPDGKTLVYHASESRPVNIWTSDLGGGEPRQLTHDPEGAGYPVWSRDGKMIAYELLRGSRSYLAVMDREGRNQVQLNNEAGHAWVFDWSHDGRELLFAGFRDGSWNLWWFDRATKQQRRITDHSTLASYVRYPSSSPKGDRIVYEYGVTRGNVYTVDLP